MWRLALVLVVAGNACKPSSPKPVANRSVAPPHDSKIDPCAACGAEQVCIQHFSETCEISTVCVARSASCPELLCTFDCEKAYCEAEEQCRFDAKCGTPEPAGGPVAVLRCFP